MKNASAIERLWNSLPRIKRYALLTKASPGKSGTLRNYEMTLKWDKLLPSTQQELERIAAEVTNERD